MSKKDELIWVIVVSWVGKEEIPYYAWSKNKADSTVEELKKWRARIRRIERKTDAQIRSGFTFQQEKL